MSSQRTIEVADSVRCTDDAARRRVANYFDRMQVFYSTLWSHHALHYGLWEAGTRRHAEAIRNADRVVARELALPRGSRVLDAGCGVGGTSLFLAREHGLEVVGITLSATQVRRAQRLAELSCTSIRPTFLEADYLCTGFPDASFDGVFGLESVCYAEPKRAFVCEAFRLLRPGGRLTVLDGFLGKRALSVHESRDYRKFIHGVALSSLAHPDDFAADLRSVGFENVRWVEKSNQVMRSAVRIKLMTSVGVLLAGPFFKLGLLPPLWLDHGRSGTSQQRLFRTGAFVYGHFTATKPRRPS